MQRVPPPSPSRWKRKDCPRLNTVQVCSAEGGQIWIRSHVLLEPRFCKLKCTWLNLERSFFHVFRATFPTGKQIQEKLSSKDTGEDNEKRHPRAIVRKEIVGGWFPPFDIVYLLREIKRSFVVEMLRQAWGFGFGKRHGCNKWKGLNSLWYFSHYQCLLCYLI